MPWELTKEMEAAGVSAKVLTPKMLRALLRVPSVATAVPSVVTLVDLLEFCCVDLYVDNLSISTSRAPHVNSARQQQPNEADTQFIRPLSRELGAHASKLHQGSGSAARARPAVLRVEQQTQTESQQQNGWWSPSIKWGHDCEIPNISLPLVLNKIWFRRPIGTLRPTLK